MRWRAATGEGIKYHSLWRLCRRRGVIHLWSLTTLDQRVSLLGHANVPAVPHTYKHRHQLLLEHRRALGLLLGAGRVAHSFHLLVSDQRAELVLRVPRWLEWLLGKQQ